MTLSTPASTSFPAGQDALPAVATKALTCRFGDVHAVEKVDLVIPAGSICGLLGPDGAGKSTLIRMLATVQRPTSGDADVFGASVRHAPGRVTPRLGYMSQRFSMYPDLTVAENIDFFATIRGVGREQRRTRAHDLLVSMGLDEFAGRQAGKLSGA
ncbi:MAG: ABC transporter ATP-binding protein [Micropruina sp.]|nr:MAG: ABC transporter ATP-binding protein [Micropruina sp.]